VEGAHEDAGPEGWIRISQKGRQGGGKQEASQRLAVELGSRTVPWATGRAEEQTVDHVQSEKIANRIGHCWRKSRRTCTRYGQNQCRGWQEPDNQDDPEVYPLGGSGRWPLQIMAKTAASAGGSQVPLMSEREGFMHPGHGQEGHFREAPGTGGIIVGGGRGWAIWRAVQAVNGMESGRAEVTNAVGSSRLSRDEV
jgi:hypothetical protein